MNAPLKISVVTPSYNSAKTIRETIESVLGQGYSLSNTSSWTADQPTARWKSSRRIPIWLSNRRRTSHYHAMNKGIQRATGGVVGILNSDDYYCEGAFDHIARAIQEHPSGTFVWRRDFVDGQGRECPPQRSGL